MSAAKSGIAKGVYLNTLPILVVLTTALSCKTTSQSSESSPKGVALNAKGVLWPDTTISVCFENADETWQALRGAVKELYEKEFNDRTVIRLVGFENCQSVPAADIHIQFLSDQTTTYGWDGAVKAFGRYLRNIENGLRVRVAPGAAKLTAGTRYTFLHEMGHAIGLLHEHGHADSDCNWVGGDGPLQVDVSPYDKKSIMSYCTRESFYDAVKDLPAEELEARLPELRLSDGDISTINGLYSGEIQLSDIDWKAACQQGEGQWIDVTAEGEYHMPCCMSDKIVEGVPHCTLPASRAKLLCEAIDGAHWYEATSSCCSWQTERIYNLTYCPDHLLEMISLCGEHGGSFDLASTCCQFPEGATPPASERYRSCDQEVLDP